MIELKNIEKVFDDTVVLKNINVTFKKGEVTVIIGPSGSGKSTLLRTINWLEKPTQGDVYFEKERVQNQASSLETLRTQATMVFQAFHLFNHLTVLKNCTLGPIKVLKQARHVAEAYALEQLKKVGMDAYKDRLVNTLSGGQKQRVAIARALTMAPKVILFDEPTSALDIEMVQEVVETIKHVASEGLTMVLVTHEIELAKAIADRVIFMDQGEIVEDRKNTDIFTQPKMERTKQFLQKITH